MKEKWKNWRNRKKVTGICQGKFRLYFLRKGSGSRITFQGKEKFRVCFSRKGIAQGGVDKISQMDRLVQGFRFRASSRAKPEQFPAVRPHPLTTPKMWIEGGGGVSCALAMDSHRLIMCGMGTMARMPRFSHPRHKRPATTTQTCTFYGLRQALNPNSPLVYFTNVLFFSRVLKIWFFLGLNFVTTSHNILNTKQNFWSRLWEVKTPLRPLFLCFSEAWVVRFKSLNPRFRVLRSNWVSSMWIWISLNCSDQGSQVVHSPSRLFVFVFFCFVFLCLFIVFLCFSKPLNGRLGSSILTTSLGYYPSDGVSMSCASM